MDMKRTTVTPDEQFEQQERKGFLPVCCYGSIKPEQYEIGGIFKNVRNYRIESGLYVYDAECVERIFIALTS